MPCQQRRGIRSIIVDAFERHVAIDTCYSEGDGIFDHRGQCGDVLGWEVEHVQPAAVSGIEVEINDSRDVGAEEYCMQGLEIRIAAPVAIHYNFSH